MAAPYDTMISVLRLLVEEDLKTGRWRDPRPPGFRRRDIAWARYEDDLFRFELRDGTRWEASPADLTSREVNELLDWAELKAVEHELRLNGAKLGIRTPHEISPDDAIAALAEIHLALYFERDNGSYRWNPAKDVSCPDLVSQLNEIMARHGMHPSSFPVRRPFVHRPGGEQ